MKTNLFRPAIAMIELIFAIVVMGISLLSIPIMLESASKSSGVAFQQESIAIIASHANAMMTYEWDENNTATAGAPSNLLITTNGDNEIDGNSTLNQANQKRTMAALNSASPAETFGFKKDRDSSSNIEAMYDDVDDFDATEANLSISLEGDQVSSKGDYMDVSIKISTDVRYLDDTANYTACSSGGGCAFSNNNASWNDTTFTGTSNIKLITSRLSSSNVAQKKIVLRAFMCNIGAARPNIKGGF
ncbi:MAG: hypothetical protein L3J43_04340 [Sulfurovum sp.]|nr:hypothetical protein [Sulfurovum sp.]